MTLKERLSYAVGLETRATIHRGKNLAPTFRIWDKMFGTYVDPETVPAEYPVGLDARVERKQVPRMRVGLWCRSDLAVRIKRRGDKALNMIAERPQLRPASQNLNTSI